MSWRMFFVRIFEIVFIVNIAILDIVSFQSLGRYNVPLSLIQTKQIIPTSTPTPIQPTTTTPTPPSFIQTVINQPSTKEIFIPLGTGQSTATDWTNVDGTQVSLDSTKYSGIKQVVFEAAISVPTANEIVYIRLFNISDGHPVWYSDVVMSGASQFLTSQPITLDIGIKTYQVQMKTQLQYPANLTQSRIHITLN